MRRLTVFNQITLDGFFTGMNGDISWAKEDKDPEWTAFIAENAKSGGPLIFGRVTYEMMASYWPTPEARKNSPEVANQMNSLPKFVFSKTLDNVAWNNTELIKDDLPTAVRRLKDESGKDLTILGSGTLVSQLAQEGLIDEYMLVQNSIILGKGRTLFEGVKDKLRLRLTKARAFRNGKVLVCYQPAPR